MWGPPLNRTLSPGVSHTVAKVGGPPERWGWGSAELESSTRAQRGKVACVKKSHGHSKSEAENMTPRWNSTAEMVPKD